MKVYPLLKLRVSVDDITSFMEGRIKELPGIAEKVLKAMRLEVEEKSLKLSITEAGRDGKCNVVASCGCLEQQF